MIEEEKDGLDYAAAIFGFEQYVCECGEKIRTKKDEKEHTEIMGHEARQKPEKTRTDIGWGIDRWSTIGQKNKLKI